MIGFEFAVHFKRDACVFSGRPGAHRQDRGGLREAWNNGQNEQGATAHEQFAPGQVGRACQRRGVINCVSHSRPLSLWALRHALRLVSAYSRKISMSGGERTSPAFSGHSMRTIAVSVMSSRNPASSHSLASRSEEHTSELQSLMRISYAVFCLKKKKITINIYHHTT